MKVLILSTPPSMTHGWGRYTHELITALAAAGAEIIFATSHDAPAVCDLPLAGYHRTLPSLTPAKRLNSLRLMACAPAISALANKADVVHVLAEPYALAAGWVTRPLFITAHGTYLPASLRRRGLSLIYRRIYKRSQIMCVSDYTQTFVRAALPDAALLLVPNGVNAACFQRVVPLPLKDHPTILTVGEVKARKGFHIVAQAMKRVRAQIPNAQAVFIGSFVDPAYRAMIQAQIDADGLTNAIHWLGRVSDETLLGWYHAADAFVLPSLNVSGKFEGFGLVYLEASAAGLPVIGTRDCGAEFGHCGRRDRRSDRAKRSRRDGGRDLALAARSGFAGADGQRRTRPCRREHLG